VLGNILQSQRGQDAELQLHAAQGYEYGAAALAAKYAQPYAQSDKDKWDYEPEAPPRFRSPMVVAAVLAGAIMAGCGIMYGYEALFSGARPGDPVVRSASTPTKVKPDEAAGKQFAAKDVASDIDANGIRKVSTFVVGRDGNIEAPRSGSPTASPMPPRVPGVTLVDGLGELSSTSVPQRVAPPPPGPMQAVQAAAPAPIKVLPPIESTGSIDADAGAAAATSADRATKPTTIKTAALASDTGSTTVGTTGKGFVAVLTSVPRSTSSRTVALKHFANMQQKYGGVLAGKTPDVAEVDLGTKGNYHRLVLGPAGSREQARAVCSQLKSQGYADCWVTSY